MCEVKFQKENIYTLDMKEKPKFMAQIFEINIMS